MESTDRLVGRRRERAALGAALAGVARGEGPTVLVSGDAGSGKSRLVGDVCAATGLRVLDPGPPEPGGPAYGPVVAAIRSAVRERPDVLDPVGSHLPFLAPLLPELGPPPAASDRATLVEALCRAVVAIGRDGPAAIVLDDLHRADDATLELLPPLARAIRPARVALIGVYRTDEPVRSPVMGMVRAALRRDRRLTEIALAPLPANEVALLAEGVLGARPSRALTEVLTEAGNGVPLLVEVLAGALAEGGRLCRTPAGLALDGDGPLPVPLLVSDAVAVSTAGLSPSGRAATEAVAVGGAAQRDDVLALVADPDGIDEAVDAGVLLRRPDGGVTFRSGLAREAVREAIPAARRRQLHRMFATRLSDRGAPQASIAAHWLAAGRDADARASLVRAAEEACAVHAYGDAARAARRALELWPAGERADARLMVVERLADCAELSGDLDAAALAWREVADTCRGRRAVDARARVAAVAARRGRSRDAVDAALAAANGFAGLGDDGAAASERLLAAAILHGAGDLSDAMSQIRLAAGESRRAGRDDLVVRSMVLEGVVLGKLGAHEQGLAAVRTALGRALELGLGEAAEAYAAIPRVIENSGDYDASVEAYAVASTYCAAHGADETGAVCRSCMAHILRITGRWRQAIAICEEVLRGSDDDSLARCVAGIVRGSIHACRGEVRPARRLLSRWAEPARRMRALGPEVEAEWFLARVAALEGDPAVAAAHCRAVLGRWAESDDHHYAVHPLRWSATWLAISGHEREARACAEALGRMAAATGSPEVLSALAHAVGETALLDGDPDRAASEFLSSLALSRAIAIPQDRAETRVRAGVALLAAGRRDEARAALRDAGRVARRLGARPLAAEVARLLAAGGEGPPARGGPLDSLSPREVEVLGLLTAGGTNRAIADELVLSVRTVDMHVRHILTKLDCRSRAEAAARGVALMTEASGDVRDAP